MRTDPDAGPRLTVLISEANCCVNDLSSSDSEVRINVFISYLCFFLLLLFIFALCQRRQGGNKEDSVWVCGGQGQGGGRLCGGQVQSAPPGKHSSGSYTLEPERVSISPKTCGFEQNVCILLKSPAKVYNLLHFWQETFFLDRYLVAKVLLIYEMSQAFPNFLESSIPFSLGNTLSFPAPNYWGWVELLQCRFWCRHSQMK